MTSTNSVGRAGFIEEHGLYTDAQRAAIETNARLIEEHDLRTVRIIWVDQHGAARTKFLSPKVYLDGLGSGIDFSAALYNMDTGNNIFSPVFAEGGGIGIPELTGYPDMVLVPDPETFRILPWVDRTGWVLCDAYFANGRAIPIDARRIMRDQVEAAAEFGFDFIAGLEVEFYVLRRDTPRIEIAEAGWPAPPPHVSVREQGYQYLSEVRLAGVNDYVQALRDNYIDLGMPLRSIEDEWGPGQLEVTFEPLAGIAAADAMILFRTTAKQLAQEMGLHATFMTHPAFTNFFSSGWHLHESLRDRASGTNAFASSDRQSVLSETGLRFTAGIIDHALPMTVLGAPTVTGYKRFKAYSFAPDRAGWATENRGAFIRVQGGPMDSGTHIEERAAEPCANPYYHMAANIAAGLDGIRRKLDPPPMSGADPYADSAAPKLPGSLWEACEMFAGDAFFRRTFGDAFVDYYSSMKRHESARFLGAVTDWEMTEYFDHF